MQNLASGTRSEFLEPRRQVAPNDGVRGAFAEVISVRINNSTEFAK
jgi:hypothetical protein